MNTNNTQSESTQNNTTQSLAERLNFLAKEAEAIAGEQAKKNAEEKAEEPDTQWDRDHKTRTLKMQNLGIQAQTKGILTQLRAVRTQTLALWVAIGGSVLGGYSACVATIQGKTAVAALSEATKSATAASQSAATARAALTISQRPYVKVSTPFSENIDSNKGIELDIRNYGHTPAIIQGSCLGIRMKENTIDGNNYSCAELVNIDHEEIMPSETIRSYKGHLNEYKNYLNDGKTISLYGSIRYMDNMGNSFYKNFCNVFLVSGSSIQFQRDCLHFNEGGQINSN
ncbi:hypothetical protein JK191_13665 [Gluconobacter sphaericus]|uniref:hypothetical protein n=1 Tax=Gluconobacter sphaericus TaxID=574987 RepID=UPI001B8D4067|nr:hypothetical protein [Gluconobacter sphaericus]MBS1098569.1 hypothetical protein [Gluconobacter sphaericus]